MKKYWAISALFFLCAIWGFTGGQGEKGVKIIRYWTSETDPISIETDFGIIRDFEKNNPNVRIQAEYMSWTDIWVKLIAAMRAGTEPEILYASPWDAQSMGARGWLSSLDDVVNRLGKEKFVPMILNSMVINEEVIGIPSQISANRLFYRKDVFASKGLQPPTYEDELLSDAEKLTEDTNGDGTIDKWGYVQPGKGAVAQEGFFCEVWRRGGYLFDADNNIVFDTTYFKESVDALNYMGKLAKFCPPGMVGYGNLEMGMAYVNEQARMVRYPGRLVSHIERNNPEVGDKTGAVVFPMDREKKIAADWTATDCWVMLKNCKYPDVGKAFLYHYMTGDRYINFLRSVPLHLAPSYDVKKFSDALSKYPEWEKYAEISDVATKMLTTPGIPHGFFFEHPGKVNPFAGDVYGTYAVADQINAFFAGKVTAEEAIRTSGAAWRKVVEAQKAKGMK